MKKNDKFYKIKEKIKNKILLILGIGMIGVVFIGLKNKNDNNIIYEKNLVSVDSQIDNLSKNKISWGLKRKDNHEQPELGNKNMDILNKYQGIALGNKDSKVVYLTFDEGYEAGYTNNILDTLKDNNVKAAFFITGHYLNTQEQLVKRMIDEGHIVGNQFPYLLMELKKVSKIAVLQKKII